MALDLVEEGGGLLVWVRLVVMQGGKQMRMEIAVLPFGLLRQVVVTQLAGFELRVRLLKLRRERRFDAVKPVLRLRSTCVREKSATVETGI